MDLYFLFDLIDPLIMNFNKKITIKLKKQKCTFIKLKSCNNFYFYNFNLNTLKFKSKVLTIN